MKKSTGIAAGIAMLVIAICATQCSKKKDSSFAPPANMVTLKSSATLGNYLADKNGHALYFFSNDANGQNNCSGGCAALWAAYSVSNLTATQLDAGLNFADFGTVTITSGTQLTYKGWPLYTYTPNGTPEAAGQTTGDGVGGIWFVAKPDYSIMLANWQLIGANGIHYKSDYTVGDGSSIYFTDALGHTLYIFKKDSANLNKFTKSDFSNNANFPIYDTVTTLKVPSVLDKTQFTSTSVFGKVQLSYKGWPLYFYGADSSMRAKNKGITVGGIGTIWPVAVQTLPAAPHP
jgi:predicted lipoprotein with Yx(FWY)xxD motif